MRRLPIVLASFLALSCGEAEPEVDPEPVCDGKLQTKEGNEIDSLFDADGDGFMDGNNPDCAQVYDFRALDCDDNDPQRHPGQLEVQCNDLDDDCNDETEDRFDLDNDGVDHCSDCDDNDSDKSPDNEEVCWDDLDNDCDSIVDEGCGPNYNGRFTLDQPIEFQCGTVLGIPTIDINFDTVSVIYNPPYMTFLTIGSGIQPGSMDGELEVGDTDFEVSMIIVLGTLGSCEEAYRLVGTFTDVDHFEGVFEAYYDATNPFFCLGCDTVESSYDPYGGWSGPDFSQLVTATREE